MTETSRSSIDLYKTIANMIADDLPPGSQCRLTVVSNSMQPLFQAGDQIVIEIQPADTIGRGDIVLIKREYDYLTHRVIAHLSDVWITKGDRVAQADPPIGEAQILGRVIQIESDHKVLDLRAPQWAVLNRIFGWLSFMENQANPRGRLLRLPFRAALRAALILFTERF